MFIEFSNLLYFPPKTQIYNEMKQKKEEILTFFKLDPVNVPQFCLKQQSTIRDILVETETGISKETSRHFRCFLCLNPTPP